MKKAITALLLAALLLLPALASCSKDDGETSQSLGTSGTTSEETLPFEVKNFNGQEIRILAKSNHTYGQMQFVPDEEITSNQINDAVTTRNNLIVYVRNDTFAVLGGYIFGIPTPIIIAAICVIIVTLVLKKSAMGMYIQSVGINKKASRIAGLNSQRIIFLCYVLCGLCAGIAGVVASSRITSADTNNIGLNFELDAILAVALGGNSLAGGKFNLAGSIIGAYTIQAITTTMYNLGVSSAVNPVFKAVIVIVIVAVQAPPVKAFFKKLSAKRQAEKEVKGAVGV